MITEHMVAQRKIHEQSLPDISQEVLELNSLIISILNLESRTGAGPSQHDGCKQRMQVIGIELAMI